MIVAKQDEPGQAPVVDIVACEFGTGHEWVDITTVMDIERRYQCRRCDAIGREED